MSPRSPCRPREIPRSATGPSSLGAPQRLTQLEVVAIYERVFGHAIDTDVMEISAIEAMLSRATTPTEESLAGVLFEATEPSVAEWPGFDENFGFRRTSVADFAASQAV